MFDARGHWNKSHLNHPRNRDASAYAKDKERSFPKNSVICDLGGGDGTDSFYFLQSGHKVHLFDISNFALSVAIERAREYNLEKNLIANQLDLSKDDISLKDKSVDIVYSRLALHFFSLARTADIFKEIFRVLKENGVAYVVVKSPEDQKEMKWLRENSEQLEGGIFSENGLIKTRFTKEQYEKLLEGIGIKNFKVGDYIEKFGEQKVFVKSKADEFLYIEIIIKK